MREQSRPRHLSLHNFGHFNTMPRNWTCGTPRSSAQCALCSANALQLLEHGQLELVEHGHRDVNPRKVKSPSICTPPWTCGGPKWAVTPGVVGADHRPAVTATPTPHVPPPNATVVLAVSQSDRERDGHLHQLFHHRRLRKRGARPPGREWSRIFSTSTTKSTICGSEVWRRGTTGTQSTICSTVRRGKVHADGLLFVTVPRTQPPLSPSLHSSHQGLPTGLSHELSVNCAQTSTRNLSEPGCCLGQG